MAVKIGNKLYPEVGGQAEIERAAGMGITARGGATPVRGQNSLQRALQNAEGDDDLLRIKKNLERRGIDTSGIREFDGL